MITEQAGTQSNMTIDKEQAASVSFSDGKTIRIAKKARLGGRGSIKLFGAAGLVIAAALTLGIMPRIAQSQELDRTHQERLDTIPEVTTALPTPASAERTLTLPGNVEAVLETPIYARSNGYIRARHADIGDRVKSGQVLADVETPEVDESLHEAEAQVLTSIATRAQSVAGLDRARADVDKARADLAQARATLTERESDEKFALSTYKRYAVLVQQGAVSLQDGDEKETRYKTAQAATLAAKERVQAATSELAAAQARIKAEEANVHLSDANVMAARAHEKRSGVEQSFRTVTAPFAGIITERNIDPGTLVSSGSENSKTALYRLAKVDIVKVFVDVPQYAAPGVRTGQKVEIKLKEFPTQTFTGTVARTSVALDPTARTLRTEIHIANKDERLAPGMYADALIKVPRTVKTFLVPSNSIIVRADGPKIAIVDGGGQIRDRHVTIGADLGSETEIIGGLQGNEKIVINPTDTLTDGKKVTLAMNPAQTQNQDH